MKYKVGDKIRLKGTDSAGTVIDIIIRNQLLIILSDGSKIVERPENVVLIEGLAEEKTKPEPKFKVGDSVESEEEIEFTEEDKYWCDIMSESDPTTYVLPQGYQFKDENGNVINAQKIVLEKKKKEYPKTYKECCKILGLLNVDLCFNAEYRSFNASKEQWKRLGLMNQFYQLLICRDAYWKIAGEENKGNIDYVICNVGGKIINTDIPNSAYNHILMFPTEEMRDAFYENFKELIEQCKELL